MAAPSALSAPTGLPWGKAQGNSLNRSDSGFGSVKPDTLATLKHKEMAWLSGNFVCICV
jgi:hypothetical protein